MRVAVRLAVRDWDYMTPLALGDVTSDRLDIRLERVGTLPHFANDDRYDASEISFSRYTSARVAGDKRVLGLPNFLMRGFRHRCAIVRHDSPLTRFEDLKGCRIGLTGWQDSGNTWTRAALARCGVGIEDVHWYVGRLTEDHPVVDRLGGHGRPGRIEAIAGERPMMELLESGELDAVFTPFMPPHFFDRDSRFRHLLLDFRAAERAYFDAVGYVPGIHLLGIKTDFAQKHPWLPGELSALLDLSREVWLDKRRRYADTTPWIIEELGHVEQDLPDDWDASGLDVNQTMIRDFVAEAMNQGLIKSAVTSEYLFPSVNQLAGENA